MAKDLLKLFGLEDSDEITEEQAEQMISEKLSEKDRHITELEEEREALSRSNEELSASVEGEKAEKEKLDRELSVTKGKLDQITEMYKEQFSKSPDEPDPDPSKDNQQLGDDVLQQIIDA